MQPVPLFNQFAAAFPNHLEALKTSETEDLQALRQQAFERFQHLGFPTTKLEDWKQTNILPFLKESFVTDYLPSIVNIDLEPIENATIKTLDCYRIVLWNGIIQTAFSDFLTHPGIKMYPLSTAKHNANFLKYFAQETRINENHFTTLNTALFADGIFLSFAANLKLDKPIHFIHVYTGENLFLHPRHLIILEENAEANIIETVISPIDAINIFVNSVSEIELNTGSRLNYYSIQTMAKGIRYLSHVEIRQKERSFCNSFSFSFPRADIIRNNLHFAFDGQFSETNLYGLYLAAADQLIDNHTLVDHRLPNCKSNQWYKGIMLDKSHGVFNGKIKVHRDAQKTNAYQRNNNLLIGQKARINTKPQLEIYADDVKCTHGCTVGRFDDDALFYLQSRGISEATARAMLVEAFAMDVIEQLHIPELKEHLHKLIAQHLPTHFAPV